MTLRSRLFLAQLPLALALVLVGQVAIHTVAELGRSGQAILADNYRSVLAAQRMKEYLERLDSAVLLSILGEGEQAAQISALHAKFEQELATQEANITEAGELEVTSQLRRLWSAVASALDSRASSPDVEKLRQLYREQLSPDLVQAKVLTDTILTLNQDAMVRKSEAQHRHSERMNTLVLVSLLAALGVAVLASTHLTNRALRPVGVLSQAVRRVGEGDLQARAIVEGTTELVQLSKDFNAMAQKLEIYRSSSLGELLQAQQLSQAAIDSLPDPVVVFGADGAILNVNGAAEPLLGLSLRQESELLSLVPAELRDVLDRVRAHVLSGKGAFVPRGYDEAVRVESRDGPLFLLPRASPVYSDEGGIVGATVILQDVTRLKRFDELKNDLVATVAHEFRTPLTSLRMAIHLCLEQAAGPVNEKQADLLQAAREDCERLQRIVDDLLDLSRMQAGRMEINIKKVDARAFVDEIISHHQMAAEQGGVDLSSMVQPQLEMLQVDPERLGLALDNLIANAIRYTPKGGSVEVRALKGTSATTLEVRDTGMGIEEDQQRRIFDKFYRVPGRAAGGAGLGLSIAREIVEAHGGEMGVESKRGEGSRFWIVLPVRG